jgi:hypothetical protein
MPPQLLHCPCPPRPQFLFARLPKSDAKGAPAAHVRPWLHLCAWLLREGYQVDWRLLLATNYGAPNTRLVGGPMGAGRGRLVGLQGNRACPCGQPPSSACKPADAAPACRPAQRLWMLAAREGFELPRPPPPHYFHDAVNGAPVERRERRLPACCVSKNRLPGCCTAGGVAARRLPIPAQRPAMHGTAAGFNQRCHEVSCGPPPCLPPRLCPASPLQNGCASRQLTSCWKERSAATHTGSACACLQRCCRSCCMSVCDAACSAPARCRLVDCCMLMGGAGGVLSCSSPQMQFSGAQPLGQKQGEVCAAVRGSRTRCSHWRHAECGSAARR